MSYIVNMIKNEKYSARLGVGRRVHSAEGTEKGFIEILVFNTEYTIQILTYYFLFNIICALAHLPTTTNTL